jgi:hypothetical protein
MFSSQNKQSNVVLALFQDNRTVFRLNDIALITGESNFESLNKKLNYAVRTGKLQNPRKGIYTKQGYNFEELACSIYKPSYISLEYVLQKAGIIFQYDTRITVITYLSRKINVENKEYMFRKIKNSLLVNTSGILRQDNHINIATAERAFLDQLYLDSSFYFDNLNPLDKKIVYQLLPLYQSKKLEQNVKKLLRDD